MKILHQGLQLPIPYPVQPGATRLTDPLGTARSHCPRAAENQAQGLGSSQLKPNCCFPSSSFPSLCSATLCAPFPSTPPGPFECPWAASSLHFLRTWEVTKGLKDHCTLSQGLKSDHGSTTALHQTSFYIVTSHWGCNCSISGQEQ